MGERRRLRALRPQVAALKGPIAAPLPKETNPHYSTKEHRAWRQAVVKRAKGRCQAPDCRGHAPGARLFADHIVELSDGGSALDPANGQALCGACHTRKTAAARAARLSPFALLAKG